MHPSPGRTRPTITLPARPPRSAYGPEATPTELLPLSRGYHGKPLAHCGGVTTRQAFGRNFIEVAPELLTLVAARACGTSLICCGPGTCASSGPSWTIPSLPQRPVRRPRPAAERLHRGGRRAPHVPGHRHGDHHGQARWRRAHRRARRGAPGPRRLRRLHPAQPAVLPARTADHVGRAEHRQTCPPRSKLYATPGEEYKFLLMAKGGGSANKSFLYQQSQGRAQRSQHARLPRRRSAPWAPPPARRTTWRSSSAAPAPSSR